jgi:hypothetical protein
MRSVVRSFALVLLVAGCADSGASTPTWVDDVQPILVANCARCHGANQIGGAPVTFRLDRYADHQIGFQTIRGAATMARFVEARVEDGTMPPDWPLTDRQQQIIRRWWEQRDMTTGLPALGMLPADHAPTVTLSVDDPMPDQSAPVAWNVADDLRHEITGTITVDTGDVVTVDLHAGADVVEWDTGAVSAGPHMLTATIHDDGADEQGMITATLPVTIAPHPQGNVAPVVTIKTPAPYPEAIFDDAGAAAAAIRFTVKDPDPGQTLTATIVAFHGDTEVQVEAAVPVVAVDGMTPTIVPFDTRGAAFDEGTSWHVRVTVDDGHAQRTAESAMFTISHHTTTDSWATVGPIFMANCVPCHHGTAPPLILPGVLDDWSDPVLVAANRGFIYRRLQKQEMPPPSIVDLQGDVPGVPSAILDDATRTRLMTWLLAGAPQ